MKRIKILARKNLKMSSGKLAAQAVHAALALTSLEKLDPLQSVVVLEVTDKKFNEKVNGEGKLAVVRDAGYFPVLARWPDDGGDRLVVAYRGGAGHIGIGGRISPRC